MTKMAKWGILALCVCLVCVGEVKASFEEDYSKFKNNLNKEYGFNYDIDYSLLWQRSSPGGKNNAFQSYLYPSFVWTNFNNVYGVGSLNFSYNSVYYGKHKAESLENNSGFVTPINDFDDEDQEFSSLFYTYQLPNKYDWLTIGLGQYNLYQFDGTTYDGNQQVNFVNYALSQNATATYSSGGVGFYIQASPESWTLVAGGQDATDVNGSSVRFNSIKDKHYATFGQVGYNPTFRNLGKGQYSILVYNQPYVKAQPQSTTGWSVNLAQDVGAKVGLFGRINGVSGHTATINQSYVVGTVLNNPFERNKSDQIGLAYAYNKIDERAVGTKIYHKAEQVLEAYWSFGISKWAILTPDFQFYIHPALAEKSKYGTVSALRFTIFF